MSAAAGFRIGTRGSQLALRQARIVAALLAARGAPAELVIITTTGDRLQNAPLSESGGKRLFVKEIEEALMRGDIDLAVHSAKDLPAVLPEGLAIAATLPREDPRDAVVLRGGRQAADLAELRARLGSTPSMGTGSVRRAAQLTALFPGASFPPIRGNVDTRLRKLDEGACAALVLASAGLRRLGLAQRITFAVPVDVCVPAPGQGILAVEIRQADDRARAALQGVHDELAGACLRAEQSMVAALGGGCDLPLGCLAIPAARTLELLAVVAAPAGDAMIRRRRRGPLTDPGDLGQRLADELVREGALDMLDAVRRDARPADPI